MSDESYDVKLVMTRGTGSNDKEKLQVEVSADTLEELDEKVAGVRERMGEWADEIRHIQPNADDPLPEDQSTLGRGDA
ncbi:DUF7389 domain-containing protein [Halarchaeum nitratireducens]|uniref:DUF7389 domain-containing protein n=1 Tax=Halarchaeum nitratireducens TaxID=489913 RepID=A0A830GBT7_9EURY|nr:MULTISPECIES: hypothetical protein [Halarchaeum]MBP2251177.1 hypothetical protein [Halarchaeum solikamskense]GGN18514.1 hypothetical protein GCM10009021_19370 [Halarchaeum nitratireducens]